MNIIEFQKRVEKALKKEFPEAKKIVNQQSTTKSNPPFHTFVEIDNKQYGMDYHVYPDDVLSGQFPELLMPASWVTELEGNLKRQLVKNNE